MTFTQFKYLSTDDQIDILWKRGIEVGRRQDKIYYYILYQVDAFYMEIIFKTPQKTAEEIVCFEDVDLVKPYLQNIDIDSLLQF